MKHNYLFFQRSVLACVIVMWLVALTTNFAIAQQRAELDAGVLRIKVTEQLAAQIESARITRSANNNLVTGIVSIDIVNAKYGATGIRRVFRPAGKFEEKHRKYGLHLWYEIQINKSVPVLSALADYKSIQNIQKVEPSYKKAIIGSDRKDFGPRIVDIKDVAPATLPGASNDPMLTSQWHYNNTGQAGGTPGSDISLFQAWGLTTGIDNVIIGVTDGGAQVDHPDLAANMWVNVDEIPGNDLDDDNNGFVDDINGYGFGDDTGEIAPDDHGTHTSGTIAAVTNNGLGVAGVAGGSGTGDGARIMTLAAFGGVGVGGFAESYIYGADNGAVISQNSWGYTNPGVFEQAVLDAIDYFIAEAGKDADGNQVGPMRGGIVIFAAGNNDSNEEHYPGFYAPTLAVSAVTNQDKKAWYSNFGEWVDIAAPGGETFVNNDPKGVLSTIANGQYAFFQGTSMACPHVSGVAALIVSKFGGAGFTPEMLRGRLTQLVDDIDAADPAFAGLLGSGRLNAFSALQSDDGDAPDAITDLAAADVAITSVTLTWTSPSDPGNGSASVYDIRYSTSPITADNFDSATAVVDPPAPLVAGSSDSLTISGLAPGTNHFFAIKSADFFGNFSEISNVLEQATNFPPVISVSPTSLSENLQTAQTSSQPLTISNTGLGVLNFTIVGGGPGSIATPSPSSGSVAAGTSLNVDVAFDANNLLAGTYEQGFVIFSNDPVTDSIGVPVTLNVTSNGQPIASVQPDTLDFGQVFETGSIVKPVTVHNAGAEDLIILGVSSENSDFTSDFSGNIVVGPFEDAVINITYTANSLGTSSSLIIISTNDPAYDTLYVVASGEGVVAPMIEVTPSSLSETLNTDKTSTQSLTISNTGGSDLTFAIEVAAGDSVAAVTTTKTISIPVKGVTLSGKALKQSASGTKTYSNEVKVRSVGKTAVETSVLIVTPDGDVTDVESILDAFDDVEADVFPVASLPGITLADIEGYDIVFTTNNGQWLGTGGVEPDVIGDLLADYVDGGGKVIVNQFAYSYDAWQMTGRFIDENYGPFTPSTTDAIFDTELGTILAPGHPILDGVSELFYSGFVQNVGLTPGSTAIAEWANGDLFLAANANVVGLNMLPSLGNGGGLQWAGDLPTIYQNSIHYLGGPSFVTVNPIEGVVSPGAQLDLEVTFNSSGLDAGDYPASINITNNAPNHELIVVPALLTVLGHEFTVSPDSLSEDLEQNQTSTQTIILSNNGPDDHTYTASVPGGILTSAVIVGKSSKSSGRKSSVSNEGKAKQNAGARSSIDFASKTIVNNPGKEKASGRSGVATSATGQFVTTFEEYDLGDINGQNGWFAQWGNWTVEAENPSSGAQHFRGLSDGFGFSLSVTPAVPIGVEDKSTTTMKVNLQGSGVTWQIIPESPSVGFVNTRIQFGPDGSVSALVDDGAGGAFFETFATAPSGYFDLTIEVDRATSSFDVYFDDTKVYTGQGFAGDIEEVVILSLMEIGGPTLDVDDLLIIDGTNDQTPPFLEVSPTSGNLPSGASVAITVTFNSTGLDFDTYHSAVNIDIDGTKLTVPASLRVFGDPNISVDPTVLQATVDYKGETTKNFEIKNTGGNPLTYSLQVIGAETDVAKLPPSPVSKLNRSVDKNTIDKKAKDDLASRPVSIKPSKIELYAGTALLQEDFEGGSFPPSGWTVVDNAGTGVVWDFAAAYGDGNYCGTGEAATVNSDASGTVEFDTELITPWVNTAGYKNIVVQYNVSYINFINLDFLDVDIQVDGGSWTNVSSWNEDHGTFFGLPGEFITLPLEGYLEGASSFRLRWHYYDPNEGDWDWYAQVDDITVLGDARAWVSVSPASGIIPVQGSADIAANFDASDVDPGFYVAGILVNSNAPTNPLVGVVASLTVRDPAVISVVPGSLSQELNPGGKATQSLTISNSGESVLKFGFGNTPVPASIKATPKDRVSPTSSRVEPMYPALDLKDTKAIKAGSTKLASTPLYITGFEEFAPGDINGQEDWVGQFANWTIEADNAFEGTQHFRGLSDGLGLSLAFSPLVAIGSDPVSSTTMQLDVVEGVTWQIIPQSPAAALVNTRFEISPDGSLKALVTDSLGSVFYAPIAGTLPDGYFEFRLDINRATSVFTIFIDGTEIFTGQGFAGDIEQVVIFSLMEDAGQTFDIDNLAIYDGPGKAAWLSYNPKSGVVPPGGSTVITVAFDATDLEGGTYYDTLQISSNDPENSPVLVPVSLVVNAPPVIAPIDSAEVIELGTLNVTFTATDDEGEAVTVVLQESLSFITPVSSGDGTATYKISPQLGDGGEYILPVVATDATGGSSTANFHLTVVPYGVENFSLVNFKTNTVLQIFDDSVVIDIGNPAFNDYKIRANTNPSGVGSVRFSVDNQFINNANSTPYDMMHSTLRNLTAGAHILKARSFTKINAKGSEGQFKEAIIYIVNSAAVTDFDVVRPNNSKLADIQDAGFIDISNAAYANFNIKGNTSGGTTRSVVFKLNGITHRVDNSSPYNLNGIMGGGDLPWNPAPGVYTVEATPYSQSWGQGIPGQSLTITITVSNGPNVPAGSAAGRTAALSLDEEQESSNQFFAIHPVPVRDDLNVKLHENVEGNVGLVILSAQGNVLFTDGGDATRFHEYSVSTNELGLAPGIYLVQVQLADGKKEMRKFAKE